MDQPQEAQKTAQETSQVETPTTETKTTEGEAQQPVETTPDQSTPQEAPAEPEVKKPTRAEKRLQQLLEERREERQQAVQQPNQAFSNPFFQLPPLQPYTPQVQPGQEITPDQYKADVTRTASDLTQVQINKLRQDLATERQFEKTISDVERTYPILNPDSENYSEAISKTITDMYDKASGGRMNPKLLKDIVEGVMSLQTQARTEGQAAVTNQLARQQAEAAISPTGSQSTVSDFDKAMQIKDPRARQKALEKILPVA